MKNENITVLIKEPGMPAVIDKHFPNTLEAFQSAVDGYIECVRISDNILFVCNEDGIRALPYNFSFDGMHFFGTIIAVAEKDDEFASLKPQQASLLKLMVMRDED